MLRFHPIVLGFLQAIALVVSATAITLAVVFAHYTPEDALVLLWPSFNLPAYCVFSIGGVLVRRRFLSTLHGFPAILVWGALVAGVTVLGWASTYLVLVATGSFV